MGAGGEPGHVHAGLGDGVLGGTPSPARHRLGLLKLFLVRGQQLLDHLAQPGDVGGHPVDALAMALSRPACSAVKNSAPSSASSSSAILRRAAARAS